MMRDVETVAKAVFDELRRDRDSWRRSARALKGEVQRLEMMLSDANRAMAEMRRHQARQEQIDRIFGGV